MKAQLCVPWCYITEINTCSTKENIRKKNKGGKRKVSK